MQSQREKDVYDVFDKMFKYIPDSNEKNQQIENGIYPPSIFCKEFIKAIEMIKCCICNQVCLDCFKCPQNNEVYCKKCFEKIEYSKCKCGYKFDIKQIDRYKFDKFIIKLIGYSLFIRCENCEKFGKTQTRMELSHLKEHLLKCECEYSSYQCLMCGQIFSNSKNECIKHSSICGYSDINCSYCKKTIKAYSKKIHEPKCSNEKIECDLCHVKKERKNMENHKLNDCEFRNYDCKVCGETYIFKEYKENHTKEKCQEIKIKKLEEKIKEQDKVIKEKDKVIEKDEEMKKVIRTIVVENHIQLQKEIAIHLKLDKIDEEDMSMKRQNTVSNLAELIYKNIFDKSSIIKKVDDMHYLENLFDKKIKRWNLLYKMTKNNENTFHQKCDNHKHTLSLIEIEIKSGPNRKRNVIYGGYADKEWDSSEPIKKDSESFIFSFSKQSKSFKNKEGYDSLICYPELGPSFGVSNGSAELWIKGKKGGYNNTCAFGDINRICTGKAKSFDVSEIEVYEIIFE